MDIAKLIAVAMDLKPIVEQYKAAKPGGISVEEGIALAVPTLAVLTKHGVTIEDLAGLAKSIGPLLPMLKELAA